MNDSGPGIANTGDIRSFTFKQTSGAACKPVVITSLPVAVGNIAPGASSSAPVEINFTGCATNARFTVDIGLAANNGKATGSIVRQNDAQ